MTKKDFEEILLIYKDQIESFRSQIRELREEKVALIDQNNRLQEAIINIKAPEAYGDLIYDRHSSKFPNLGQEEMEKSKAAKRVLETHLKVVEQPLFVDANDMIEKLAPALTANGIVATESIHNNSES